MGEDVNLKNLVGIVCKIRKGRLACKDPFSKEKPKFEARTLYLEPDEAIKKGALVNIVLDKTTGEVMFGGYEGSHVECKGYSDGIVRCEVKVEKKRRR